jgi:phospholipase/lecithinase/hemolysin
MKPWLSALFVLVPMALCQPADAQTFSRIVAFGDSLTDVGNVAGITEKGESPRIKGYYEKTHFSDYWIWIEYLADYWGLPPTTPGRGSTTSLPRRPGGSSWAWGGAEAASGTVQPDGVTEPFPNLLTQVQSYLSYYNSLDPLALYVVWAGADNLLIGGSFGPLAAKKAVKAVITSMRKLERHGARQFVVLNMPSLSITPRAQEGGIVYETIAKIYTDSFNYFMKKYLKRLKDEPHFDATVYSVDAYAATQLIWDTVKDTGTYTPDYFVPGPPVVIENVTDEALDVYQSTGYFPENYLFWDGVHPTTQGHQMVAGKILQAIQQGCSAARGATAIRC